MKRRKIYILEKFFPSQCPKCEQKFTLVGKDFYGYGGYHTPSKLNESKKLYEDFLNLDEGDGIIAFSNRYDIDYVTCAKCENVTLRVAYGREQTFSFEKVQALLQKKIYNSYSEGTCYGEDEYASELDGKQYLYFIGQADLKRSMAEQAKLKMNISKITNEEDKFSQYNESMLKILEPNIKKMEKSPLKKVIEEKLSSIFKKDWHRLHDITKKFLISAEFYLMQIETISGEMDDVDYSPVVLEFSKALEKEIYEKIFMPLRSNKILLDRAINSDTEKSFLKAYKLYTEFLEADRDLTLGQMNYILKLFQNISPFAEYLGRKFEQPTKIFDEYKFCRRVDKFNYKFRNKSAHITPLTLSDSLSCKEYLLNEPIKLLCVLISHIK